MPNKVSPNFQAYIKTNSTFTGSHRQCFFCIILKEFIIFFFIRFYSIAFGESQSEDEQFENDLEIDPPNWQQLVSREVLLGLKPCEIKRQEVINGEFN